MSLQIVNPAAKRFLKGLIIAPPGHGKTYMLGTAQLDERTAPMLFLDFEGGEETLAGLEIDVLPIRSWDDYSEVFEYLSSGDHWMIPGSSLAEGERYRSLGIDSISETHIWALLARVSAKGASRNEPDLIEQGDYGVVSTQMRRLLREFRDLPMHVFYSATTKEVEERGVGKVKVPALSGQMAEEVAGMMSVVGYLAKAQDDDGEEERILLLQNYPGFRVKARVPWGESAPDELDGNPTIGDLCDALGVSSVNGADAYEDDTYEDDDDAGEDDVDVADEDDNDDEDASYDAFSVKELREELKARDIKTTGNRAALIERLEQWDVEHDNDARTHVVRS